jgi:redox-sensing transcriptional repressor
VDKQISPAVIRRMPRYYRYLTELLEEGTERISSGELSRRMKVTASQIRQDLNNFGEFGQQGYGYNVQYLHDEIGKILGIDHTHNMIIIGSGHLGQALANYSNFKKRGFEVVALFDVDPALKGKKSGGVEIHMMEELDEFVKSTPVHVAALTLPKAYAREAAEHVIALGIKAIWNFAHMEMDLPEDVTIESVHLSDSLMHLSYLITDKERQS